MGRWAEDGWGPEAGFPSSLVCQAPPPAPHLEWRGGRPRKTGHSWSSTRELGAQEVTSGSCVNPPGTPVG